MSAYVTAAVNAKEPPRFETFYTGVAARGVTFAPYTEHAMRGIEVALALGLFTQAHLDRLDSKAVADYFRHNKGVMKRLPAMKKRPKARKSLREHRGG